MIKTKLVKKEVEVEEIEDIICNNCGESLARGLLETPEFSYGLVEINYSGGWHSYETKGKFIWDGVTVTFSICEKCLDKMCQNFKIPPKHSDF